MSSFLDTDALNNAKISSILEALIDLEIVQRIINWTGSILKSEVISFRWSIAKSRKIVIRVAPGKYDFFTLVESNR